MKLSELFDMYYNGPVGETIFSTPFTGFHTDSLPDDAVKMLKQLNATGDDRSKVLVSALVCEVYIDRLLGILLPGYKELIEDKEFPLSRKIKLLRAFKIIPLHLTQAADLLRKVRNEFAHDLDIDSIEKIPDKLKQALKGLYLARKIRMDGGPEDIKVVFMGIAQMATNSLYSYKECLTQFNRATRTHEFAVDLATKHKRHNEAVRQKLVRDAMSKRTSPEFEE